MIANNEIEFSRLERINRSVKGIAIGIIFALVATRVLVFVVDKWVVPLLVPLFYPNSCGMWRL